MALLGQCHNHSELRWAAVFSRFPLKFLFWNVSDRVSLCRQAALNFVDDLPASVTPPLWLLAWTTMSSPFGEQLGEEESKSMGHQDAAALQRVTASPLPPSSQLWLHERRAGIRERLGYLAKPQERQRGSEGCLADEKTYPGSGLGLLSVGV